MTRIISNLNSEDFCFESATFKARLLAEADQILYQQLYCNQQVMQYIGTPLTAAQARASFIAALNHNELASKGCQLGSRVFLVLTDSNAKQLLGLLSASLQPAVIPAATAGVLTTKFAVELGIMLLPSAQKMGVGQAAIAALCQKLQGQPNLYCFTYCTAINNFAAKKLVSRLGFVYCENRNCYQLLQ